MDSTKDKQVLEAYIPVTRDANDYNMHHKNRGMAVIFNHEQFDSRLPKRYGAAKDLRELKGALEGLRFDVIPYEDSTICQIFERTKQAADFDHTHNDCIVICILTHGDGSDGYVQASDGPYCLDRVFQHFTADRCPTLAGKPKLFFIQACRGGRLDDGHKIQTRVITRDGQQMPSASTSYRIPLHADFLMAYSSIPEFASWRNPENGSWFIQALVKELNDNGRDYDILSLLTLVNRRLAIEFESYSPNNPDMDYKKQISCFTSMLTRFLRF